MPGKSLFILPNVATPGTTVLATITIDAKGRVTSAVAASTTGLGDVVLATSPTLTTPIIADLTNMTHSHQSAATGGSLNAAAIGSGTLANARVNWAAPSDIGTGTPPAITGTTILANTSLSLTNNQNGSTVIRVSNSSASANARTIFAISDGSTDVAAIQYNNNSPNVFFYTSGSIPILMGAGVNQTFRLNSDNTALFNGTVSGSVFVAGTRFISPVLAPGSDSTTALKLTKADGTTAVVTLDTTNSRVLIGAGSAPFARLEVHHSGNYGVSVGEEIADRASFISIADGPDVNTSNQMLLGVDPSGGTLGWGTGAMALAVYRNGSAIGAAKDLLIMNYSAKDIVFATNHVERLRIDSIGLLTAKLTDLVAGITNVTILDHLLSSGGASAGFGPGLLLRGTSGTAGQTREMGYMYSAWTTPTDLSRASKLVLGVYNVAVATDVLTLAPGAITVAGTASFSGTVVGNTFSGTTLIANTAVVAPVFRPVTDSTTALKLTKADGTTAVVTVDTTNSSVGIGKTPTALLDAESTLAGVLKVRLKNLSGNSAAYASFQLLNDTGGIGAFFKNSSNNTAYGGASSFNMIQAEEANLTLGTTDTVRTTISSIGVLTQVATDAILAAVTNVAILAHAYSGVSAPAAGFGVGLSFQGHSATVANGLRDMGQIRTEWTTAADASRATKMVLSVYDIASKVDVLTLFPTGTVRIDGTGSSTINLANGSAYYSQSGNDAQLGGYTGTAIYSFAGSKLIAYFSASNSDPALTIHNNIAGQAALVAIAAAAQTAAIQEWQASNSSVLSSIPAAGGVRVHSDPGSGAASTTTFTNATGTPSNSATPAGYTKIYVGTVASYVPYYQ